MRSRVFLGWIGALLVFGWVFASSAVHAQGSRSVTVQLQSGEQVVLHDVMFDVSRGSERGVGRRGGTGTLPPEFQPGNDPGDVPGGGGGYGGGGDDPYGPGRGRGGYEPDTGRGNLDARRSLPRDPLGAGLSQREYRNLRRVDIIQTRRGRTTGDLHFLDGSTRQGVRMNWEVVLGTEKPGGRGQYHAIDAKDILSIEFPH